MQRSLHLFFMLAFCVSAAWPAQAQVTWKALLNDPGDPVAGNPDGDVTVVEFLDYQCHSCQFMLRNIMTLLDEDPNVRVVFKEWPVFGPASTFAARAALAANKQGKYRPVHEAIMEYRGRLSESVVLRIAREHGIDMDRLRADMNAPEVMATLERVRDVARSVGLRGTPSLVIGRTLVPGAISMDDLRKAVAQARAQARP